MSDMDDRPTHRYASTWQAIVFWGCLGALLLAGIVVFLGWYVAMRY